MHFWVKVFLLVYLILSAPFLISQNEGVLSEAIKDTAQLNEILSQTLSIAKAEKQLDHDEILSLLKTYLELKDTIGFFSMTNKFEKEYFRKNGLYEGAIIFLKESQRNLDVEQSPFGDFNNGIGNYYNALNLDLEALDYYYRSVEWYKIYQESDTTVPLGNLAAIYYDNGNDIKALEYNKQALDYSLKLTDRDKKFYNVIFDYVRIGSIYHRLNEKDQAKEYYEKSLDAARKYKDEDLLLMSLTKATEFYENIEDLEYCQRLISEGDNLINTRLVNDSEVIGDFFLMKNMHYLKIGSLDKALSPEEIKVKIPRLKSGLLEYSVDYFAAKNDIEKAIEYSKMLLAESRRIGKESKTNIMSNIEEKYVNRRLVEKNKELSLVIAKRNKINLTIFGILIFISSLFVLQLLNNRRHKKLNKLLKINSKQLITSNNKLQRSNVELERFVFMVSHDLKTPLRDIVSFSGLLERQLKSNDNLKIHKYLSFIRTGGLRMNDLIGSTLEYSRFSDEVKLTEYEVVDLNVLIEEIKNKIASNDKNGKGEIIQVGSLPRLKVHRNFIYLLFQNLIDNGLKYNESEDPMVSIYAKKSTDHFSIFIEDNGIGISKEYLDHIFVMFSRLHTHDEYRGSGLGLSICKKVVEQLKGDIQVQSTKGEGSIFEIRLPNELVFENEVLNLEESGMFV